MTLESAKKYIIEQVSMAKDKYDSFEIQFMGGEPLMEFTLIQEISNWIWQSRPYGKDFIMFVQTNGTLLDETMKLWFLSHKEEFYLALSMDGTMEMQNTNRSNSFLLVDTEFFVRNWPSQNVKMTVSPQTMQHLSDGVKYLHGLGFLHIAADLAMGPTIKWTANDLIVYKNELDELTNFYISQPELEPFSMLRMDPTSILDIDLNINKTCSCGEDLVCVDWDGKTYACHLFAPISISKEKAYKSNELIDFADHTKFVSDTCKDCRLNAVCNRCYGMNYICTDDVKQPSAFHCNAFKIRYYASCKLYLKYAEQNNDQESFLRIEQVINSLKIN